MKHNVTLTAVLLALGLSTSAVYAAGSTSNQSGSHMPTMHSSSSNQATTYPGQGEAAMPGNSTAQAEVTANRKKEAELRQEAEQRAAAAKQNGNVSQNQSSIERPTISKPDITRPEIHR